MSEFDKRLQAFVDDLPARPVPIDVAAAAFVQAEGEAVKKWVAEQLASGLASPDQSPQELVRERMELILDVAGTPWESEG